MKLARKERGLTQEDVATLWGCDVKTIQRWEQLKCEPKYFDVVGIINNVCKMSLSEVEDLES